MIAASLAGLAGAQPLPARRIPATYTIGMKGMTFAPIPAGLHVGDTIVWNNDDFLQHSATAADRRFSYVLKPGQKASMTLTTAGRIAFVCKYHPGMTGVLVIAP